MNLWARPPPCLEDIVLKLFDKQLHMPACKFFDTQHAASAPEITVEKGLKVKLRQKFDQQIRPKQCRRRKERGQGALHQPSNIRCITQRLRGTFTRSRQSRLASAACSCNSMQQVLILGFAQAHSLACSRLMVCRCLLFSPRCAPM